MVTFKRYRWLVKEAVGPIVPLHLCDVEGRSSVRCSIPDSCAVLCVPAADLSHGGH